MAYRAEYIWIDGTEPTPLMRSKTKVVADGGEPELWNFDGSSTNQAEGSNSDCMLQPVYTVPDPIRGGNDVLVLCEVLLPETLQPHSTNNRAACVEVA
ncbi:MAG: glutamine synthetase beta-grasp domain-containing protein, partial [Actinobacteria bacterium]|nr:glutamine synthetase beta-grasp domain-containing protein [Actinomycetota bacterium]